MRRLPQGKRLSHCKIVNAYDPTIAPILKGKTVVRPSLVGRRIGKRNAFCAPPPSAARLRRRLPLARGEV